MNRACLMRGLLAVAIAAAIGIGEVNAACERCPPPPPPPSNPAPFIPPSNPDNSVWDALGGAGAAVLGPGIKLQFFPETGPGAPPPESTIAPRQPLDGQPISPP